MCVIMRKFWGTTIPEEHNSTLSGKETMSYFASNMIKDLMKRNLPLRNVSIYLYNLILLQEDQTLKVFINLVNKRQRETPKLGKFQITFFTR